MFLFCPRKWWKDSLNSDGHIFHQYQQNKQSPLILMHWTHTHTQNPGTCLRQAQKCGGAKPDVFKF